MCGTTSRLVTNIQLSAILSNIMRMEDPEAIRDAHEAYWQILEAVEARADELGILEEVPDEDDGGWGFPFSES